MYPPPQLTVEEQRRGEKRKVLLDKISQAGRASGLQFLQGMKAAISAVHEVSSPQEHSTYVQHDVS